MHNRVRMRILGKIAVVILLLVAAAACKHNKNANTTVTRRAAFDFSCPKEELLLNVVDTEGARKMASQIAVRGCGQKAVYVYYPDSNTWIIDGAVTALAADYVVPPPIDQGRGKRGDKKAVKAEKRGKMSSESPAPAEPPPAEAAPEAPAPEVPDPS